MARTWPTASAAGALLLAACLLGLAFSGGSLRPGPSHRAPPEAAFSGPEPAASEDEPEARREGCRTTSWSEPGFSRSLSYTREKDVATNASTFAAVLAVAHTLGEPLTLEEVTSHVAREDEVCLFTPAGPAWLPRRSVLVRVSTTSVQNVSLSHSAAIHVVALAKQGGPFRLSDMLDVQERRESVRVFEARVSGLDDQELLDLAFGRGVPHGPHEVHAGHSR